MRGPPRAGGAPKVLLVSANREQFPEPVFPLGAVYAAAAFEAAGASVRVFDAGRSWSPLRGLLRELADHPPDLVGLSLRNLDNAAWPGTREYLPWYRELAGAIAGSPWARSQGETPAVYLGGPAFSLFPDELAASLPARGGVAGDAEAGVEWVLAGGRGVFRPQGEDPGRVSPLPRRKGLFPGLRPYPTVGVQTGRGCGSRCLYCTYPLLEGGKVRSRDPGEVAREIGLIRDRLGVRRFFIVDGSFNSDEGHAVGVLRELAARRLGVRFSCYLKPRVRDPEFFPLLRRAGCVAVDFGTESGSPGILRALGKDHSPEDVRRASAACRREGIDFCHSLLFGGPGESGETIRETVGLMDETAPRAVVAMVGIRVYPGTGLERIARAEGRIPPGRNLLEPVFYFGGMGAGNLAEAVRSLVGGRRAWFFPGERDWSKALGPRLLRMVHREGPLWRSFRKGT